MAGLRAFAALAPLALATPAASGEGLSILAATNDLGAIADAVTGGEAEIEVVARSDRDPHTVEVRPSKMRKAAKADVYLEVGLSLDQWSDGVVRGSRNRKLVVIRCSDAIEPLGVPEGKVDASMGDVHPDGNPHYWLDPLNGAAVGRFLAAKLGEIDPERAELYTANAERFARDLEERLPDWEARLSGGSLVEFHDTWRYLAARFDLEIVDRVEPFPGIPAHARHLAELAEVIRERGVPFVARDSYHSESPVAFLVRETGVRAVVLPSTCDAPTAESYVAHFDRIAVLLGEPVEKEANP